MSTATADAKSKKNTTATAAAAPKAAATATAPAKPPATAATPVATAAAPSASQTAGKRGRVEDDASNGKSTEREQKLARRTTLTADHAAAAAASSASSAAAGAKTAGSSASLSADISAAILAGAAASVDEKIDDDSAAQGHTEYKPNAALPNPNDPFRRPDSKVPWFEKIDMNTVKLKINSKTERVQFNSRRGDEFEIQTPLALAGQGCRLGFYADIDKANPKKVVTIGSAAAQIEAKEQFPGTHRQVHYTQYGWNPKNLTPEGLDVDVTSFKERVAMLEERYCRFVVNNQRRGIQTYKELALKMKGQPEEDIYKAWKKAHFKPTFGEKEEDGSISDDGVNAYFSFPHTTGHKNHGVLTPPPKNYHALMHLAVEMLKKTGEGYYFNNVPIRMCSDPTRELSYWDQFNPKGVARYGYGDVFSLRLTVQGDGNPVGSKHPFKLNWTVTDMLWFTGGIRRVKQYSVPSFPGAEVFNPKKTLTIVELDEDGNPVDQTAQVDERMQLALDPTAYFEKRDVEELFTVPKSHLKKAADANRTAPLKDPSRLLEDLKKIKLLKD